jgi:hypothetical protein
MSRKSGTKWRTLNIAQDAVLGDPAKTNIFVKSSRPYL